jgi:adenylate cyclase
VRAFRLSAATGTQTIELPAGRAVLVGRAATSDVPIYDPTISRRHAELALAPNGVQVRDLGSSNGTFLNGSRITEATGVDGDVVTFGKVAFHVREVTPPGARPAVEAASFAGAPPGATIMRPVPVAETPLATGQRAGGAAPLTVEGASLEERRARRLAVLLDISKELSRHQDVDKLLHKVVDITFQVMNVDRVSILMAEPGSDELIPRVSHNRLVDEAVSGGSRHVPRSIARKAVEERLAILTDNAATDERFKGKSIVMQSVRSAMCAPLMGHDAKVLGIIYVDNLSATNSFNDEDLDFLIAFSGIAAVAIENGQLAERVRREAVVLSNFQRYFAPNVAHQIANQEGEVRLGGTKRPVVVFFSDIRDFTPLSEQMLPDEIAHLLTEYFTEMVEVVFKHGGTLDKFMGDAIMALWGAPIAHQDDADRAMRAALEMQELLARLNAKWESDGRPRVEIGIGINFGEVFAGNIGSEQRLEYTVIGDAVNVASRLCSKAGRGDILISESFLRVLDTLPPLEALDPIELKGKAKAVPVYRVKR